MNFAVLWLFVKVFSVKFGGEASIGAAQASNLRTFSPQKSYFSPIHESFLPRKFPAIQYDITWVRLSIFSRWSVSFDFKVSSASLLST